MPLTTCEVCGNTYDKAFQVVVGGASHVFDCFECAIEAMAPRCAGCACRVIGHGVEADGKVYCSAHCAHAAGFAQARDHVGAPAEVSAMPR
jgi:hypothetical protein